MFVKYQTFSFENGNCVGRTCVRKIDTLIAKKIPKDNSGSWGIYLSNNGIPVAIFDSERYAMWAIDHFCNAILAGDGFFDFAACEEEFNYMAPDNPESEDKPC